MSIVLPKTKSGIRRSNPNFLIMFGKPKQGKTTALSMLDDCLIIDLEEGSNYVDALSIKVKDIRELFQVAKQLEEDGKPYKYIALDTATTLEEEMLMPLAIRDYKATPMGQNYTGDDLRKLPNGAGYLYMRNAFKQVIERFRHLCETLILVGHCNEKMIEKEGKEMFELEIDLSGKLKRIIASQADAIGYLYRKDNRVFLNFNGGGDAIIEARSPHLCNKEFLLTEKLEDGTFINNWDQIFLKD